MGTYQSTIDVYPDINQHNILGGGGYATVFASRTSQDKAYKVLFSKILCINSIKEAEIQQECADILNPILSELPIPVHIPNIFAYNEHQTTFQSFDYNCIIGMERVPLFSPDINSAYQLGMQINDMKEHPSDQGIQKYTTTNQSRGLFINESNLLNLDVDIEKLCISWGFAVCSLIFIAHNDINDLEYILTSNGLWIIDFGMTSMLTNVDENALNIIFKHIDLDIILPDPTNTIVYPLFIEGFNQFKMMFPLYSDLVDHLHQLFDKK